MQRWLVVGLSRGRGGAVGLRRGRGGAYSGVSRVVDTRSVLIVISSQLRSSLIRTGRVHSTSRLLRSEHETDTPL